jgi:hypothetical protein
MAIKVRVIREAKMQRLKSAKIHLAQTHSQEKNGNVKGRDQFQNKNN